MACSCAAITAMEIPDVNKLLLVPLLLLLQLPCLLLQLLLLCLHHSLQRSQLLLLLCTTCSHDSQLLPHSLLLPHLLLMRKLRMCCSRHSQGSRQFQALIAFISFILIIPTALCNGEELLQYCSWQAAPHIRGAAIRGLQATSETCKSDDWRLTNTSFKSCT